MFLIHPSLSPDTQQAVPQSELLENLPENLDSQKYAMMGVFLSGLLLMFSFRETIHSHSIRVHSVYAPIFFSLDHLTRYIALPISLPYIRRESLEMQREEHRLT